MSTLAPELIRGLLAGLDGTGPEVANLAPFTGELLVTVPTCTAEEVAKAFERARAAQRDWAATSAASRARVLVGYHDLVLADEQTIDIVQAENGKAHNGAFEETVDVAGLALYYGRRAHDYLKPGKRKGAIPIATRAYELRHPKGVVAIISPFNYPLSLGVCDAIPALLAGNGVVHKPDTQVVLTALPARELLVEAGLPADLWQIVVGEPDVIGPALLAEADHLCFTGSTTRGRQIAAAAGQRLISCTLELGGKNPMLVLEDADLDKAAKGAVRACFSTTGQLCLSMERIYVQEKVYDQFLDKLVRQTAELKLGKGFDHSYDIGTLSGGRQLAATTRHVDDAVAKGGTVHAGGRHRPDIGPFFYEPTILTGVTPEMHVYAQETFGPVVSVYPFTDDNDGVDKANDTEYGLNASIWTRGTARGRRLGARIQAGTVNINEGVAAADASNDAPMGGVKSSGLGRRHGEQGMLEYCELQTVASQHLIGFDPPPGISVKHNARLLTILYKIMKATRIT